MKSKIYWDEGGGGAHRRRMGDSLGVECTRDEDITVSLCSGDVVELWWSGSDLLVRMRIASSKRLSGSRIGRGRSPGCSDRDSDTASREKQRYNRELERWCRIIQRNTKDNSRAEGECIHCFVRDSEMESDLSHRMMKRVISMNKPAIAPANPNKRL